MKMLLVANDGIATAMLNGLKGYHVIEDVEAIDFNHPNHDEAAKKVLDYLTNFDENEKLVVIADKFGSTAFNETVLALQKTGVIFNAIILRGMSLPMILGIYDLKDNFNGWQTIQKIYDRANTFTYKFSRGYVDTILRKAG